MKKIFLIALSVLLFPMSSCDNAGRDSQPDPAFYGPSEQYYYSAEELHGLDEVKNRIINDMPVSEAIPIADFSKDGYSFYLTSVYEDFGAQDYPDGIKETDYNWTKLSYYFCEEELVFNTDLYDAPDAGGNKALFSFDFVYARNMKCSKFLDKGDLWPYLTFEQAEEDKRLYIGSYAQRDKKSYYYFINDDAMIGVTFYKEISDELEKDLVAQTIAFAQGYETKLNKAA